LARHDENLSPHIAAHKFLDTWKNETDKEISNRPIVYNKHEHANSKL